MKKETIVVWACILVYLVALVGMSVAGHQKRDKAQIALDARLTSLEDADKSLSNEMSALRQLVIGSEEAQNNWNNDFQNQLFQLSTSIKSLKQPTALASLNPSTESGYKNCIKVQQVGSANFSLECEGKIYNFIYQ